MDEMGVKPFEGIDVPALNQTAEDAVTDRHHIKPAKLPVSRGNVLVIFTPNSSPNSPESFISRLSMGTASLY